MVPQPNRPGPGRPAQKLGRQRYDMSLSPPLRSVFVAPFVAQTAMVRRRTINERLTNAELMFGFGERLRWLREELEARYPLQHGQEQWARRIGVTNTMYNRWENGHVLPKLIHLMRIADLFRVSMDYLLRGILGCTIDKWLREALAKAHPELQPEASFVAQRNAIFDQAIRAQPPKRRRQLKRRRPRTP